MNNLEKKIIRHIESAVEILECMKDCIENGDLDLSSSYFAVDEVHHFVNLIEAELDKLDEGVEN